MGDGNFSRIDLESLCSPAILERGETYYREGHLVKMCRYGQTIYGWLIGSGSTYQAMLPLRPDLGGWECSCPYPEFCKHLTALALAWLEHPEKFIDVEVILKRLLEGSGPIEILEKLVARHPFDLLELNKTGSHSGDFVSNRGLINLVRNLFSRISYRPDEVQTLWERIQNTGEMLYQRLCRGDAGTLDPLYALWEALLTTYRQYRDVKLKEVIDRQFTQIPIILATFDLIQIEPFFVLFFQSYLDPLLWELGAGFRGILREFILKYPELAEIFDSSSLKEKDYLQLAACYELITDLPSEVLKERYLLAVKSELILRPEGRLWLIDRLIYDEPDEAYHMAKAGMRAAGDEEKSIYRDKLIQIHQVRHEFRQAAALSYLQFAEKPSIEEYERLREILSAFPQDYQSYYEKILSLLRQKKMNELLIRILLRAGDERNLKKEIYNILDKHEIVMALMDDLMVIRPALLESGIYPAVIGAALNQFKTKTPGKVLKLAAAYKKWCIQSGRKDLWEQFTGQLEELYGEYPDYQRKLGALVGR